MQEPKADSPEDPRPDEMSQLDELVDEYGKEWRFWRHDGGRWWCAAERFGIGRLPRRVEAPTADGLRAELDRVHLEACERIPFTTGDLR